MRYFSVVTIILVQMLLLGAVRASAESVGGGQKEYTVNRLSDGSLEITVSGSFALPSGNKVEVFDLRSKLDAAAERECPHGYELKRDDSAGIRPSANDDGLAMTQRGIAICNADDRKTPSEQVDAGRPQIWTYAFIARTNEPVSGHGGAIFKSAGGGWTGPMWTQEKLPYEMNFSIRGEIAEAMLWPKKKKNKAISLEGIVTRQADDGGCLTRAVFHGQDHFVVLEHVSTSGCDSN